MDKNFISTVTSKELAKKVTDYQYIALSKINSDDLHKVITGHPLPDNEDWIAAYYRVAGPIMEPERFSNCHDWEVMDIFHDVSQMIDSDESNFINNEINFWADVESGIEMSDLVKLINIIDEIGY
jgi:hypothetical protein